ncbi:ROK family protein [Sphingomonas xinjiangensis]|uniref:Putative NBD/HSP70 family sugar kinase n=1 Tax=Sphingomonas xinjiangensis TaxID=643568 RepID=A0A840YNN3_9SPHN|nr:ROK family transcriptional regulator [Sphingomonas xinjiangensis]MBB5711610.1 putative NBD/HSP70 family sugar kinase [Sphingomonas xinjiangensis]
MTRQRPEISLTAEQKRIVWRLRTEGPTPRIVLANDLGIYSGAMTRITREMIAIGVIEETSPDATPRGRPVVPLTISGRAGYAAGVTAHPGWIELTLVDFAGTVIARDVEPFDSPDPGPFADAVERRLRGLAMTHGLMRSRFLGIGVAATGPMTVHDPNIRWAVPWLSGWRQVELESYFADRLGMNVRVENDASLAALAEYYHGELMRRCRTALVFFLGHGVGGGIILDRALFRGAHGNAGEVGMLFPGDKPRPSGIDLLANLQQAGAKIHSLLEVATVLETHHEVVEEWIERAAVQLEDAVAAGVAWLDPDTIVLSGALPQQIMDRLGTRLGQGSWAQDHPITPKPVLRVTQLGSWAVAVGAALLPIHEIA